MKRKSMSKKKGSLVSISPSSSKISLSQSSKLNIVDVRATRVSQTETLAGDSDVLSNAKLDIAVPVILDLSKAQCGMTATNQNSSSLKKDEEFSLPTQSKESGSDKPASMIPDKLTVMSSDSTPTSPESGSPQLDQLLSDLKEMKLKFGQETPDKRLSESHDANPEVGEMYKFQGDSPESPKSFRKESSSESTANIKKTHPVAGAKEKMLTNLCGEDFTSDIPLDHEERDSATQSNELKGVVLQTSTQSIQDEYFCHGDGASTETISSQSLSDLTPETVTTARHFSFEELIPNEIFSDEGSLRTCDQQSEESLTPIDCDFSTIQSATVPSKTELASSASDEEYTISLENNDASSVCDVLTHSSPDCAAVMQHGTDSPSIESSDPEPYFDCKQGVSDFSETEPEAFEASGSPAQYQHGCHRVQETTNRKGLLSSESEEYEDAPSVLQPPHHVDKESEESLHASETSDEEFTFCEASELPGRFDTNKSLRREIAAELGSISESSDEDFFTTRIVRRRVVIQADEIAELPSQSVTEERYKDENGHIVVKRVTRKVIRKCVSAEGAEHVESPEASVTVMEGEGYSKVVKRQVVKSEGDNTEVTFVKHEDFHSSRQDSAEACKVSDRTMTSQGNSSLASDLPSAQDDFKKGPHA